MAAGDVTLSRGASAALTISLASLASSSTFVAGRESTAITTANPTIDYLIAGHVTVGTTPTAGTQIQVWAYGSLNDTPLYPDSIDGTDSAETLTSAGAAQSAIVLLAVMQVDATTSDAAYWFGPRSLSAVFGGSLPKFWGVFVAHNTVAALHATPANHVIAVHTGLRQRGTKLMARGFRTVYGSALTDKITTTLTAHVALRTYACWFYAEPGASNTDRFFDKRTVSAQRELWLYDASANLRIQYQVSWSGGDGIWHYPLPPRGCWHHIAVSYDSSSTSTVPAMYLNGIRQAITTLSSPSGTLNTNTDPYVIGNRGSDNDRAMEGILAEFAIWDEILAPAEIMTLAQGQKMSSEIRRPRLYVPMLGQANEPDYSGYGYAQTLSGTKVWDHPQMIRHLWNQPSRKWRIYVDAPTVGDDTDIPVAAGSLLFAGLVPPLDYRINMPDEL